MKILSSDGVNMVAIVSRYSDDPLTMLECGMAGLRLLAEEGLQESRSVQARVLIAGLIHTGHFLDVAAALAESQHALTKDEQDASLLAEVRALQAGGPKPW